MSPQGLSAWFARRFVLLGVASCLLAANAGGEPADASAPIATAPVGSPRPVTAPAAPPTAPVGSLRPVTAPAAPTAPPAMHAPTASRTPGSDVLLTPAVLRALSATAAHPAAPAPSASAAPESPAAPPSSAPSEAPAPPERAPPVATAAPLPARSALPAASAAPSAHGPPPAPSASAAPVRKEAQVLLGDDKVFAVRAPRGDKTAEQRAQAASVALASVVERARDDEVHVDRRGDVAVVLAGQTPIIQLTVDDAVAAGDSSLDLHAASVASAVRSAIDKDHRKRALSQTVFSISLLVFLGLIAFYLMQKIGEFSERAKGWIDANGETVLAVRVRQIEVVSPGTVRSTALVGLSVGRWLAQLGVFYAWVVVGLSFFDATRDYTGKLTGLIVTPLSQLMTRLATGLPVLAVLVLAGFVVFVLVRFLGLFFDSIERRENVVSWIAPDLAAPTGALLRVAVVLSALVYLAPLVTGSTEGTLGRTGAVALVALGLAATPLLASGILGAIVIFGRRLRAGQHVEIGVHAGRIASIGLLELRLEDAERAEVRIPHLYAFRHPTRVLGQRPRFGIEIAVAPGEKHAEVQGLLLGVASRFGDDARVELTSADAERTLFRVTLASEQRNARSELQLAIVEALAGAHVPLGRLGARGAGS